MGKELRTIIGAGALGLIAAVTIPDSIQAASISDGTITEKTLIAEQASVRPLARLRPRYSLTLTFEKCPTQIPEQRDTECETKRVLVKREDFKKVEMGDQIRLGKRSIDDLLEGRHPIISSKK